MTWDEERLPDAEPVEGIMDVSAYRVVPGRWPILVLGLDRAPSCAEDDDWCATYQVAWSWTAAAGWYEAPSVELAAGPGLRGRCTRRR